jgi:hypothetical protein
MTYPGVISAASIGPPPIASVCSKPETINPMDNTISRIIKATSEAKREKYDASKTESLRKYSPVLIGGDGLNIISSTLIGLTFLISTMNTNPVLKLMLQISCIAAGLFNIGVGIQCIIEAKKAGKIHDILNFVRNLIDGICLIAIGIVLLFLSVVEYTALGFISAWMTAHPLILPILFLLLAVPITVEIVYRMVKNHGSKLKLDNLQNELYKFRGAISIKLKPKHDLHNDENYTPEKLKERAKKIYTDFLTQLITLKDKNKKNPELLIAGAEEIEKLSENLEDCKVDEKLISQFMKGLMNDVQGKIGIEAATEVFELLDLLKNLLNVDDITNTQGPVDLKNETFKKFNETMSIIQTKLEKAQTEIKKWDRTQWLRLAQQICCAIATILIVVVFIALTGAAAKILEASTYFFLALANAIPLYMDIFLPYRRNTPMIIESEKSKQILMRAGLFKPKAHIKEGREKEFFGVIFEDHLPKDSLITKLLEKILIK